ncbi:MAG: HAMP domain-containing protein [Chloroflexi bacterium]|nr:HAMP domain-containing protein [Chloroflexota bacterium]
MKKLARFKRLGIQKRIMLYVAAGLVLMFSAFVFLGLQSIQRATQLVYEERLATAYTTAGIFERDFLHVARDVKEANPGLLAADKQQRDAATAVFLSHLVHTDPFPFFQVTGIWVLSSQGSLLVQAGTPEWNSGNSTKGIIQAKVGVGDDAFIVLPAIGKPAAAIPFGTVVTQIGSQEGAATALVAVHTVGVSSPLPYVPASAGGAGTAGTEYHLEIMDANGITILGVGEDERPGELSYHFPVIQGLMVGRKAGTFLHKPASGESFEPHVMAVVPLPSSPFYIMMEQSEDVALALPIRLRNTLVVLTSLGFIATLIVAWVTTRHVVKPTEELTAAALRMAGGDLESPVDVSAQDEVGWLAESLDSMRQKLRSAYHDVEIANTELERQVKERTARLEEVLGKVISAQEEERYRLARELHDETAQTLGVLSIAVDRARDSLQEADVEALGHISEAKAIATRLLEETRRLILDLRPQALDDLGLGPAIRWYVESHLEERGVAATVEINRPATRLPEHIEVSLFRVIQEAVNNIGKHADAKHAHVRLAQGDSKVNVVVTDDGKGFNVERALDSSMHAKNVGLLGMRERVRLLNGSMQIRSQEGKGTEVSIEIPVPEEST